MPFTSISAGWIFTLMGLLDDGRPLNQGKSPFFMPMPMKNHRIDSINLSSIGAISRRNDRGFSGT